MGFHTDLSVKWLQSNSIVQKDWVEPFLLTASHYEVRRTEAAGHPGLPTTFAIHGCSDQLPMNYLITTYKIED
jgi:hypothetical protein